MLYFYKTNIWSIKFLRVNLIKSLITPITRVPFQWTVLHFEVCKQYPKRQRKYKCEWIFNAFQTILFNYFMLLSKQWIPTFVYFVNVLDSYTITLCTFQNFLLFIYKCIWLTCSSVVWTPLLWGDLCSAVKRIWWR